MKIKIPGSSSIAPLLYSYRYDQLNRLTAMQTYSGLSSGTSNNWNPVAINDYKENIKYDANGNIIGYRRYGNAVNGTPQVMDSLTYKYAANTNRLTWVKDAITGDPYTTDIESQTGGNYAYDAIGNYAYESRSFRTGFYGRSYTPQSANACGQR